MYVGVDLAWGLKRPTGLAVLEPDDTGARLVHLSAVRTDEEIRAALASYVEGDCLVAVDAPLVVTNPTGNRPCEAALNKDFARFQAGAHPSNTGKAEFADGSRGGRLCTDLGLDTNPRSGRPRRAIEVYPHPATIALFNLPRTLKYKHKTGRSFGELQGALLELMTLLEGLGHASPRLDLDHPAWTALRADVEAAERKSQLRVAEDQVDAVLCAYVGLWSDRRPEQTTIYGDPEFGYADGHIVTPSLTAANPVDAYAADESGRVAAGVAFIELVTGLLDEAGINYLSVTGRTKSVASFAEKATRTKGGHLEYPDPLRTITDQIGVRVITYVHSDVAAVVELLGDEVEVLEDRDMGLETASEGRFGYASRHLLVAAGPAHADLPALRERVASVQVRTVLQHAWAEFEHDIRYKGSIPDEHARDLDRRFTLAAGLLELADQEFTTIRERLRSQPEAPDSSDEQLDEALDETESDDDAEISARELAAFLAGQYPDAEWSRPDHYEWMAGLLDDLDITSITRLGEVLREVDAEDLMRRMDYRYPPGAVRRLDDALLAAHGDAYVELPGNGHRADLLRRRLARLVG
jgi:predicted RNase H-like nuclease/ppGpp synthetase/RelA/SpoT-type nucleotidyltranferase